MTNTTTTQPKDDRIIRSYLISQMYGVSVPTVYRAFKSGRLKKQKLGPRSSGAWKSDCDVCFCGPEE